MLLAVIILLPFHINRALWPRNLEFSRLWVETSPQRVCVKCLGWMRIAVPRPLTGSPSPVSCLWRVLHISVDQAESACWKLMSGS